MCGKRFVIWFCHLFIPERPFSEVPKWSSVLCVEFCLVFRCYLFLFWLIVGWFWLFCECGAKRLIGFRVKRLIGFGYVSTLSSTSDRTWQRDCVWSVRGRHVTNKTKTLTRDKWSKVLKTSRPKQPRYLRKVNPSSASNSAVIRGRRCVKTLRQAQGAYGKHQPTSQTRRRQYSLVRPRGRVNCHFNVENVEAEPRVSDDPK